MLEFGDPEQPILAEQLSIDISKHQILPPFLFYCFFIIISNCYILYRLLEYIHSQVSLLLFLTATYCIDY